MTRITPNRPTAALSNALAKPPAVAAEVRPVADAPQQYLTFLLSGEMFAVAILNVKEIIEYGSLTGIPMMPPFIRGVINLRGAVVPVIDLAARFGGAPGVIGKRSCIVILEVSEGDGRHDIGVLVDAVSEVIDIPDSEIEPPPSFGIHIRADFIQAMGKVAGRFVIILSIGHVLSVDEIGQLAQVSATEAGSHT